MAPKTQETSPPMFKVFMPQQTHKVIQRLSKLNQALQLEKAN
jgi:hypothetical protein